MKSFVFPGNIEPEILEAGKGPIPYMRSKWFSDLVFDCEARLLQLLVCPTGKVIPYTASGTAAMEACVLEYVSQHRKALVIVGGTFGARWAEICRYHKIPYEEFQVPFATDPDIGELADRLQSKEFDILLMQHHETSSGYLYDLSSIGALCRENGVRLVVDAISSFLADPLSMSDWSVDVAILSSQKGLNILPGLSFVILSESVAKNSEFACRSYYLDWKTQLKNLERGQTPYSPATQLFMQLHARLEMLENLGLEGAIGRVERNALSFRDACQKQGWRFSGDRKSNCLTGVYLPFPVTPLYEHLFDKQIYVMPGSRENLMRVTHTGVLGISEHLQLIEEVKEWESMVRL